MGWSSKLGVFYTVICILDLGDVKTMFRATYSGVYDVGTVSFRIGTRLNPSNKMQTRLLSKKSPTGSTERTPKPRYLIALVTFLGVHW